MLTQYFYPETGAAQVRLLEIARQIWQHGHTVEVVTAFPNYPTGVIPEQYRGKLFQKDLVAGIPVYRTWIYPVRRGRFWQRLLNYFSFVLSSVYGVLKAGPADYLLLESPPLFLGLTAALACRLKKAQLILNVSDLWPESAVSLGLVENKALIRLAEGLETYLYRLAWRISGQTEGIMATLQSRGIPAGKLVLLPNGVNPDLFAPGEPDPELAARLGLAEKFVVLYAGTMGYAHGLEVALQAADILRAQAEIVFLFVGDGSERPRLEQLAGELNLPNVRWLPYQPLVEIGRYYRLADLSLSTLRRYKLAEGVRPSKLFPGLASGKPLIYVGEGEGARIVRASGGGVVLPPGEPQLLADAILQLQSAPEQGRKLGQQGREFVLANYTWSTLIDRWLEKLGLAGN